MACQPVGEAIGSELALNASIQPDALFTALRQFGCNVCGEGGEYETLTLDCPLFTQYSIKLKDWNVELHSPGECAAVGILHPLDFALQPKASTKGVQHPVTRSVSTDHSASEADAKSRLESGKDAADDHSKGQVVMVPDTFQAGSTDKHCRLSEAGWGQPFYVKEVHPGVGFLRVIASAEVEQDGGQEQKSAAARFTSVLDKIQRGELKVSKSVDTFEHMSKKCCQVI